MANINKIPDNLAAQIMLKSRSGESQQKIAEWLESEHKIKVSRISVQRFCASRASEYDSQTKQVYLEKIAETAVSDMEILAENTAILRAARDKAVEKDAPGDIVKMCLALKSHVELKMNVSGVSNENIVDERDELLEMINKIEVKAKKSN